MSNIKISQLPSAGALSGSEILPIVQAGDTKGTSINSIIGQVGLQQVLDNNNTANQSIEIINGTDSVSVGYLGVVASNDVNETKLFPEYIGFNDNSISMASTLKATNVTANRNWEFPDASGTLALTSDIPPAFSFETLYVTGTNSTTANPITSTYTNVIKDTGSYVKLPANPNIGDIYYISNTDTSLNLWVSSGSNNIYNAGTNSGTNVYYCGSDSNRIYVFQYTNTSCWREWTLTSGIPSSGWGLTGNAGTTPGTNFIGTTDNKDLILKRNNVEYLKLDQYYGLVTNKNILCQAQYPDIRAASYIASNRSVSLNFDSSISATAGHIQFSNNGIIGYLLADNISGSNKNIQLPNASGTLAVSTTIGYSGSKTIGGQVYTWENGILITVV